MSCVILEKVVYRQPGSHRPVYAVVLGRSPTGLSILLVRNQTVTHPHHLVLAVENVTERVYERINASQFPLETADIASIGTKLMAIGGALGEEESIRLLEDLL